MDISYGIINKSYNKEWEFSSVDVFVQLKSLKK